ncbi:cadmium resistance transporter [Lentilactobacillus senioris]|uniref:cadmium resistance transporter n=1 Tax=Lentilactobacillus senioris TaxID=931534 RepID=UPI002282DD1B|nr:cadmium resistance transporter [Lentilactobacillus senioris]MCY9805996.1 cadmium resistance transporter [Lentilactobacillus senioris]
MLSSDLGAIPLFMGCEIFWTDHHARRKHQKKTINYHVVSVGFVFITILADGGANLAIYIPFFSTLADVNLILVNIYLVILIGLWCGLGLWLTHFKGFEVFFNKYCENITGVILVVLGMILIYNGLH